MIIELSFISIRQPVKIGLDSSLEHEKAVIFIRFFKTLSLIENFISLSRIEITGKSLGDILKRVKLVLFEFIFTIFSCLSYSIVTFSPGSFLITS